jgi:hypothetical protein
MNTTFMLALIIALTTILIYLAFRRVRFRPSTLPHKPKWHYVLTLKKDKARDLQEKAGLQSTNRENRAH